MCEYARYGCLSLALLKPISSLGASPRLISRYGLISTLFNKLPAHAQAKVLPAKKLCTIQHTQNGVIASCTDGSTYFGNIIIGADGVHSATRDLMNTLDKNDEQQPRESPFLTTFRCLWMRFPTVRDVPLGTSYETHGYRASTQVFAGEDSAVMGLYERLEKPTYERIRYTVADEKAIVDRWGHLPLIPNNSLRLRDVYESRIEAGLVSLEEGVMKDWSQAGRVVLVGDAAHKFTPSTGSGFNNGVLDVAALVSELAKVIRKSRAASGLSLEKSAIQAAFVAYENTRRPAVEFECRFSGDKTQLATWQNEQQEYVDKNVVTGLEGQQEMIRQIADALMKAPSFDLTKIEQRSAHVNNDSIANHPQSKSISVH